MKARYSFPWFEWLAFLIFIFVVAKFTSTGIDLMVTHDVDPKEFEKKVSRLLGVQEDVAYSLDGDTLALAKENNLDEETLAAAIAASQWVKKYHNFDVSVGILYTIDMAEWRGGGNPGDCDALTSAKNNVNLNDADEERAVNNLLALWKEHNVRRNGDLQKEQIAEDYTSFLGHCSAGESGPGFIPTTAWRVCEVGLIGSGDPEVADCDYRKHSTGAKAIAYEVGRMCKEGVNNRCLLGWNRSQEYINRLVATSNKLDGRLGTNLTASIDSGLNFGNGSALRRQLVLLFLKIWDLDEPKLVRTTYMGANNIFVLYGHMSRIDVVVDQEVEQGDVLGLCGATGNVDGAHTHIETADVNPTSIPYRQEKTGKGPGKFDPLDIFGTEGWLRYPFGEQHIATNWPNGISQTFMQKKVGNVGTDELGHPGTDFPCATGVPLLAVASGKIAMIETNPVNSTGYGLYVVLAVTIDAPSITSTVIGSNGFAHPNPGAGIGGHPFGKEMRTWTHLGIDMSGGDPWVYAMHSGIVVYAEYLDNKSQEEGQLAVDWSCSGNTVAIEGTTNEGQKIWSVYCHGVDGSIQVEVGQDVSPGDPLMLVGDTGNTTGVHLHFGVKIDDQWVDPKPIIEAIIAFPAESETQTETIEETYEEPVNDEFLVPTPIP